MASVEHRGEQVAREAARRSQEQRDEARKRVVEPALEKADRREWAHKKYGDEKRWNS